MGKFIDKKKQPKSVNFMKLLMSVLLKHNFESMGTFQMKTLFLGMMHFQDEYTYDIHRVEKCDIHYAMPDGEVLPFCTFNVFPEVYRDKVQKQYSIPSKEWEKTHGNWNYAKDKYIRNVKEAETNPIYQKTYGQMMDYFALDVNGGKSVTNFANETFQPVKQKEVVVETTKGTTTHETASAHSHKEGSSCGCKSGESAEMEGGSCACKSAGVEKEGGCGCGNGGC
jgi:hypothetical protein